MPVVPASPEAIRRAARLLRSGGLVALPTETVYGLGGDATDPVAVARIFAAKGRPRFNPLIAHLPDAAAAFAHGVFGAAARLLATRFWPGPLTLVVRRAADSPIAELACAGLDTVALRVPAHAVAQALLAAVGRPVAAPSANRSGRISPTTAAAVAAELGDAVDLVLDAGPTAVGIESTVVDCTGDRPRLLRPGGVTLEALAAVLGAVPEPAEADPARPRGPGQLASHYAPALPVRLGARAAAADEALLAFGPDVPAGALVTRNLSPAGDTVEAAARLYALLRELDASGARAIAAMAVPETGLGAAINDRLRRAAAPRPPEC